jgi:hypothetical protein
MNDAIPYLFSLMFIAVLVWFGLCVKLFNALKERHPETYENMGSPGLFRNNTFSNNISFMRFLFKKEWRTLDDEGIAKLSKFMFIYIFAYTALLIAYFYAELHAISP